ncbi:MAG: hypothetical protein HY840_02785 [Bacteroidetes bacterium]|nr:hypothetical protein [Bacteroidota bacterium]
MSKNSYERAAQKKSLLGEITKDLETKGDLKNTAIETLKDVVIGVVAGGVAGSAIGRASLLIGAAVTGLGHYYKSRLASIFGVGMMAANGFQQTDTQMKGTPKDGLEGALEGAKERVMNFKDTFGQKLFLDKVLKSKEQKKEEESTKGVGDVQYFTYPENKELGEGKEQLDLTALDKLEKQVAESGASFSQKGTGNLPANEMGEIDPSEQNF